MKNLYAVSGHYMNTDVFVVLYGATRNWNFGGKTAEEAEEKNPGITAAIETVRKYNEIEDFLAPKPAFNARVVEAGDLPIEVFPHFWRGADADGVILTRPGQAYALASADCMTVVLCGMTGGMMAPGQIVAALHCGRDAMIDRGRINGKEPRGHESVIDAAIEQLLMDHGVISSSLQVHLTCGIRPETYTHSPYDHKWGSMNRAMLDDLIKNYGKEVVPNYEEGTIDLFRLARRQLIQHGVPNYQITEDDFDTATDVDKNGEFLFHSNRRPVPGALAPPRNLVVVGIRE